MKSEQSKRSLRPRQTEKQSWPVRTAAHGDRVDSHNKPLAAQDLKFVDLSEEFVFGRRDAAEKKSIRVHVMQDFLRHRKEPEAKHTRTASTDAHVHIGRFRLAKPPTSKRKLALPSTTSAPAAMERSYHDEENLDPKLFWDKQLSEEDPAASAQEINLEIDALPPPRLPTMMLRNSNRGDPFLRLPIDATIETHETLEYYYTSFWENSLAVNPDGKYFSVAVSDPALFHASMSLVTQHEAATRGTPLSAQYYAHRGAAIHIISTRIGHPVESISDVTIGTVAILASADTCADISSNAHIHGLASLVELRGGLQTLSSSEQIKRVVTWADLVHAASYGKKPSLTISKCNAGSEVGAMFGKNEVATLLQAIYHDLPPVPEQAIALYQNLRLLCIAKTSPDIVDMEDTFSRRVFANVLYRVEYLLLDQTRSSTVTDASESADWALLASIAGGILFTYSRLRSLVVTLQPFQNLIKQLRRTLEHCLPKGTLEEPTPGIALALALWLLFVGFDSTNIPSRADDHEWFIRMATEICRRHGVRSRKELSAQLRQVVVLKTHCPPIADALWSEIEYRLFDTHEVA